MQHVLPHEVDTFGKHLAPGVASWLRAYSQRSERSTKPSINETPTCLYCCVTTTQHSKHVKRLRNGQFLSNVITKDLAITWCNCSAPICVFLPSIDLSQRWYMRKKNDCILNLKKGKAIRRRDIKQTQTDDQTHLQAKQETDR